MDGSREIGNRILYDKDLTLERALVFPEDEDEYIGDRSVATTLNFTTIPSFKGMNNSKRMRSAGGASPRPSMGHNSNVSNLVSALYFKLYVRKEENKHGNKG